MEKLTKRTIAIIVAAAITVVALIGAVTGVLVSKYGGTITVTFVTNGGTELEPLTLKRGRKYTLPTTEKDGLVFADWYYDENFGSVCKREITAKNDLTLYARFGAILTFDVGGGTDLEPRMYFEGEELGSLPATYKNGFSFGGWFYDSQYDKVVGRKDSISGALTVYAKFSEKTDTLKKLTSVKGVSVSPAVEVKATDVVLHNENVSEYISLKSASGEEIEIICAPSEHDKFVIQPARDLIEGETYSVKALSSLIKITSVGGTDTESADEVTITTHKEEKEVINKKPTVHLSATELAKWEENVYVYMDSGLEKDVNRITAKTKKEINVGTILTIGEDDKEKDNDYICKVISVKREKMQYFVGSEIKEDDFTVIEVVTPNVDDVYDDIDVYGERQAQLEGYVTLSAETVAENVEKNQGVVVLKKAVRNAVAQSPTVVNYANALSEAENIALMAAIGGFEFKKPKVSINISGTMLEFEIELGGEIQVKNFKIGVEVTISNSTRVDYRYTICKSGKVTLNPLLWFYTDIKVDLTNDFSISLAATVEFGDAADEAYGIIDITDEVEYVMDIAKDGQNKFAEAIGKSPFWDESDLEYADIFSIPLGQIPLPVPVVSLMLEFNVVGSLGARAGLYVEFAHHYVESTSLSNGSYPKGENGKPVMFNEFKFTRATLANEIDLSVTLKGQVGFRCGLEAKLSVSFAHLNKVAAVYVSFRFGPYIELSGLVSFHYNYDVVNKVSKTQLYGGMYLEVGLFVNAKLGARFLVYDVNTDIFDKKIPLYGVGDRLIPLGFTEESNTPENPYVLTSRSSGVRMSTVQMRYLDIVTGEEVVDSALRNRYGAYQYYSFEFYDAPDYQTKDYDKYVVISNQATLIKRSYPYKSLKFAVKAILQQKQGVYANGIERIFYVEFRNPDGRDYATQYSEFINEYYVGGGATHYEVLERVAFMEGEQVTPPDYTIETLPVRQGYYLDINDLWEKYYPFMGGQVDENFDGTFPVVTYENATEEHKGYIRTNTCFYRLKWKQRTYTANFYYPEYSSADVVSENKALKSAEMIYVPYLRAFIVKTDSITAPDIYGKKYDSFVSTSGLIFTRDYYNVSPDDDAFTGIDIEAGLYPIIRVDTGSNLFLENFELISGGADFVATYTDENVYTETYVLETDTLKRVKVEYKPFDYGGKTIRPMPPEEFSIGKEFTANGGNTYVIMGYRDINSGVGDDTRYYSVNKMPNVDKNRIYYLIYERNDQNQIPYYISVVANGQKIGEYGVIQGEKINVNLLKINFDAKTVVGKLAGYPTHMVDDAIASYSVDWSGVDLPERMPAKDLTINITAEYTFKNLSARFVVSNPLQSFVSGVTYTSEADGSMVHTETGRTWTYGAENENAFYSLPELNDYYDTDGKKYYAFCGWKNSSGEEYTGNVRLAFVKNEVYTPVFNEQTVLPTVAFISVGDYGYEYYYKIAQGDYFGKTLADVIRSENIKKPVRGDVNNIFEYEFTGWGVDENSYVIGSEKDADGKVKTYLTFKAQFAESYKYHIATFEAMDGAFGDGEKTRKLSGRYGDDLSYMRIGGYTDEKGTFTFVCWTTVPYSFEHRVDEKDMKFGNADITYYAYYTLDPATITLTFKGKVKTEETDGTGNVYFYGDKTKTELTVSDLYGRGYYLTANVFAVDSKSKTFVPDYLRWVVDGEEYTSMFYNDGYMAYVPFDNNAVIEIVFKAATDKIINICFLSDGECYTLGGEKIDDVICKGYMSGFRHVANYYQAYGTTMTVPNVDYYSEYNYRFDHWEARAASNGAVVSVMPYDEITFTEDLVFQGVYVRDDNVKIQLTFRSEPKSEDPSETGDNLTGLRVFADGSVEIKNYGTFGENIAFDKVPTCSGMKFIGWTDGKVTVTSAELAQMTYSAKTTYYAVFEPETDVDGFEITLNAGDGSFAGGADEIKVENVAYGKLTAKLDIPAPNSSNLVFSHYEDENGYPVTAVEKSQTLYAKYAIPVSDYEGLKNINLAPDRNYVLTNDIKAGGNIWFNEGVTDWVALGADSVNGFSGVFNGNGYKLTINSNGRAARNFGLFSKISGTVYNLSVVGGYTLSGSTDASSVGAFTSEVTASGKIVDCQTFIRFEIHATATQKMNVSGAIGVNNGLIDGLMSSASGDITVDGNKELTIGATVGTNNGTMKNVNQAGRIGYVYVNLSVSLDCNIGSFAGYNAGVIENSFSERSVIVNFSQGNNVYRKNSVMVGGFVGRNAGTIRNSSSATEKAAFTVRNLTILDKEGLELDYNSYSGYPCYIISEVTPGEQGSPVYKTLCVIYLDENAVKTGSDEYEEYTLSEFEKAHAKDYKKILSLKEAFTFGDFIAADSGLTDNCTYIQEVGTGNGTELVASCGFSGIKWNYLTRLHNKVYSE